MCSLYDIPRRLVGNVLHRLLSFLLLAVSAGAAASGMQVTLLGDDSATHRRVLSSLEQSLAAACRPPCVSSIEITARHATSTEQSGDIEDTDLIVAIGSRAGEIAAQMDSTLPRLHGLIPKAVWTGLAGCCDRPGARRRAIFIDQPLLRQFRLVGHVRPGARRVGVLLGSVSRAHRSELIEAAEQSGFELNIQTVDDPQELGSKLRLLAKDSDVLLALPDPAIYNRNTIYSILLTSYSARIPLVGYSDAMVKAGAAAAVYMSPEDAGREIARAILDFQLTGVLDGSGYGDLFSVSVNHEVIKSLRLPPLTETRLLDQIKGTEP